MVVKENNSRVLVYSRFPMKAVSLNPSKRVPTVGHTSEGSPGNPHKTSDLPTKSISMHIMSYGQDDIYAIHLRTGLYCITFSLLDSYTPAPCYYFLTASALLKSIKTHPLTLRILLLISLYITLLFFFFITLLFIIKSLHLLPVRGELTLEFLKEGKELHDVRDLSVGSEGESLQTSIC